MKPQIPESDAVKRVHKTLGRFRLGDSNKPYKVRLAMPNSHGTVVQLSNGGFVFFPVRTTSIDGVLTGRYNVHVYAAVQALQAGGFIAKDDADAFFKYCVDYKNAEEHTSAIQRLEHQADNLGYKLVAKTPTKDELAPALLKKKR